MSETRFLQKFFITPGSLSLKDSHIVRSYRKGPRFTSNDTSDPTLSETLDPLTRRLRRGVGTGEVSEERTMFVGTRHRDCGRKRTVYGERDRRGTLTSEGSHQVNQTGEEFPTLRG